VPDFNFVTARLATGGAVSDIIDVQALVDAGITHVIDCRNEFDDSALLARHSALMYLWNGVEDDGSPKTVQWFAASLSFAMPALAQPNTRVYAHCAEGVNRGPSTCYAIMRALGFPSDLAVSLITASRPVVKLRYREDADRAVEILGYA
jgi:dual specificity phosphatase 3